MNNYEEYMVGNILLAGPWIGEFGWELFCWQGYLRKLALKYDKTIVIGRPGNKVLYDDFCDEYIEFDPKSWKTDGWRCKECIELPDFKGEIEHTTYVSGAFDIGYLGENKSKFFYDQKFHKYESQATSVDYDILFHCRNKTTGSDRNWSKSKWQKLYNKIPKELNIACIGNDESYYIEGCDDLRGIELADLIAVMNNSKLIIGPSSGPMHLASLCGLSHLVWSANLNEDRYKKDWNPFSTEVIFYDKELWNPKVNSILKILNEFFSLGLKIKQKEKTAKKLPKVTVVTVTYNAEEVLEKTILNVIEQDYKNLEYIIVDGNSTDKTLDIIKKYETHITKWISESDSGIYEAMNKGIDASSGEWINFMNAGDIFYDNNSISKTANNFHGKAKIICGNIIRGKNIQFTYRPRGLDDAYNYVFVNHQASFVHMKVMKRFKFSEDVKISGDYGFFFKAYKNGVKFKFIDDVMAISMEDGISQVNDIRAWAEALYLQAQVLENPLDAFKNNFYKHLASVNNNNKTLVKLLNKLHEELEETIENKKFVLYGYGTVGQIVYQKYKDNILAIVDRQYELLNKEHQLSILPVEKLHEFQDEYIFISAFGYENIIKSMLNDEYKISRNKILEVPISGNSSFNRYCPICKKNSHKFKPYGLAQRRDAMCPHCGSTERDRLAWLFLTRNNKLNQIVGKTMLHVAPEKSLGKSFNEFFGENYLSADLFDDNAMVKIDIMGIPYSDESFDFIYCSHVLEHVSDDRKAMREFFRVLKKGGWAILNVPIIYNDAPTFEDPSIIDPQERTKIFGQADHVRNYGTDYVERLQESGFFVEVIHPNDFLSDKEREDMGITKHTGKVYFCTKRDK